ncbi:class I SAM-dependent methyltransferase [Aureimonas flava]|uniref:Class I SAM-dependent methyltransferase n=1 Tax=Aureimonas flava TaxID=2320271 RepID=A0A3A1WV80_9HYPH|nr:class I SAM-dependent methyltransferase [Aureimonas flava]RIY02020.1 class I SAM-dependent methyltransferase [Aureimonas flava]
MSGFDTTWLDLREPADHAARDHTLLNAARAHLRAGGASALAVDLGSGTGSTLRAFGPDGGTRWRLVDHDPRLLEAASARLAGFGVVERVEADLGALPPAILDGARLVTASALFDLVSRPVVERLAAVLAERRCALYAALNYDGRTNWDPPLEADPEMLAAFNAHQAGDKGLGPALGPGAADALRTTFEGHGYTVRVAPSPWRLGHESEALRDALLDGFAGAVRETGRVERAVLDRWTEARRERPGACHVGHWDVLTLPPGP